MELKTWTRRANALKAVQKLLGELPEDVAADAFITGTEAADIGDHMTQAWAVRVFCEVTPSEAAPLQEALGNAAQVVAELEEAACATTQTDNGPVQSEDEPEAADVAAEILATLDLSGEFQEMADKADAEHEAAEEADKIAKRRASADRQPTLKGQRLSVVGGKDAANPFREGCKSHVAFDYLQKNPGSSYEDLKAAGIRMRTITYASKIGLIRAL